MPALSGRTVVLGVSGGIAAYKAPEIIRRMKKSGATVFVILTEHGSEFISALTLEALSGNPVVTHMFQSPAKWEVEHIALAKRADLFLIAPATANILAKIACGIADDMLSTTVLATHAPLLVAPAMNTGMWDNAATRANMETLRARGVYCIGPESGMLANGDSGAGRMAEPPEIVDAVCALLSSTQDVAPRDYTGKTVLITAGPTREPLDPVRYLSNRSSGKMGYALAEAALARGAQVTLVSGPVSLAPIPGVEMIPVQTTQDLYQTLMTQSIKFHIVIQAAAPADYRAETVSPQKIKKQGDAPLVLRLVQNPDVAAAVGAQKQPGQILVGFAAETENVLSHAEQKLEKKNLDMIIVNDVTLPGAGFDVDTNIATFITRNASQSFPLQTKRHLADAILDAILQLEK